MQEISNIEIPNEKIARFCRRNRVRKLSLFGSVLREDFKDESDVDVLIEFEEGCTPGFFGMAGLELELSKMLKRKVDLRTPAEISRHFRDDVVQNSAVQYVQG